jgi:hypothetical protein
MTWGKPGDLIAAFSMAELENNQFRKNATAKAVTREDNLLGRGHAIGS